MVGSVKITRRKSPPLNAEGLHPLLARVYAGRGVSSVEEVQLGLRGLLPPDLLMGMPEAVAVLEEAVLLDKRILVVGDYDADGATATAVSVAGLKMLGASQVDFLVPDRFKYGYGLSPEIVDVALARQPDVLMTVDNGISSVAGVARAKVAGVQVVITDHHLAGAELPAADAIVNPNQPGCDFPSKALAGCGVAFYVIMALRASLRARGWFGEGGIPEPAIGELLDIVAVGTVADVVSLDRNNRILVQAGLDRIRRGAAHPGVAAIIEVAGKKAESLTASDLGFSVGPRLNAAGRIDDMSIGISCLLESSHEQALEIARRLHSLNEARKDIESKMQVQAMELMARIDFSSKKSMPTGLCLYQKDWHQGVIGILASRIKDAFHRPTVIFAADGEHYLKGSARSVSGFHIRDAFDAVATRHPDIVVKFGGHAMAAGLTIRKEHYKQFCEAFDAEARRFLSEEDLVGVVVSDGELDVSHMTVPTAEILRSGGPWGQGFQEPVFDGVFEVLNQKIVGEKHLKLTLGLPNTNSVIDAIAFNVDKTKWPSAAAKSVQLAYKLDINEYKGVKRVQLMVEGINA